MIVYPGRLFILRLYAYNALFLTKNNQTQSHLIQWDISFKNSRGGEVIFCHVQEPKAYGLYVFCICFFIPRKKSLGSQTWLKNTSVFLNWYPYIHIYIYMHMAYKFLLFTFHLFLERPICVLQRKAKIQHPYLLFI